MERMEDWATVIVENHGASEGCSPKRSFLQDRMIFIFYTKDITPQVPRWLEL